MRSHGDPLYVGVARESSVSACVPRLRHEPRSAMSFRSEPAALHQHEVLSTVSAT